MQQDGLRDRKKAQTRQRIADVAATLFAERGYDAVSMSEVARAAEVSDQTVYNYFAAKQDLVLDLADQIREWYRRAVGERQQVVSPAAALEPFVLDDIERYRTADLAVARGEFLAQCLDSATLRRFALEERERQTRTIAAAISVTDPDVPQIVAHAHAAALVAVIQVIHDQIGASVLNNTPQEQMASDLRATVRVAFDSLARTFTAINPA